MRAPKVPYGHSGRAGDFFVKSGEMLRGGEGGGGCRGDPRLAIVETPLQVRQAFVPGGAS